MENQPTTGTVFIRRFLGLRVFRSSSVDETSRLLRVARGSRSQVRSVRRRDTRLLLRPLWRVFVSKSYFCLFRCGGTASIPIRGFHPDMEAIPILEN